MDRLSTGATGDIRWRVKPETPDGLFGFDVALVPDLHGDTRAEVLVGQRGAGAVLLSGVDGAPLFRLGDSSLGPHIGSSVAVLKRAGASPFLLVGASGVVHSEDEPLPDPAIHVYDAEDRSLRDGHDLDVPNATNHELAVGMRLRSMGDLNGDEHDDLATCKPNGYFEYGPSGRLSVCTGADDETLASTWYGGAGLEFLAWQFGTDARVIRFGCIHRIVIACPQQGGVAALSLKSKVEQAWVRQAPKKR